MSVTKPHFLDRLFYVACAVFVAVMVYLAAHNNSAGEADSCNNLDTARHLVAGHGFKTSIVQQLLFQQPLPDQETFRFPGVPFLLAFFFKLFGVSLAWTTVLNTASILLTALLLRMALRHISTRGFANWAGLIYLLSPNYEIECIWSNNFLVLCTTALLYLAARYKSGKISGPGLIAGLAILVPVGFYFKPTFILSAVPFVVFLMLAPPRPGNLSFFKAAVILALMFAFAVLAAAPYWLPNVLEHGDPFFSYAKFIRLIERYKCLEYGSCFTARFGAPPITYRFLIDTNSWWWLIGAEVQNWISSASGILQLNPVVFTLAALLSLMHVNRQNGRWYVLGLLLAIEPLFSTLLYWNFELRYLWPLFPILIFLAGLGWKDFQDWGRTQLSGQWQRRMGVMLAALMIVAFAVQWRAFRYKWVFETASMLASPPEWAPLIRQTPPDTVILSDHPWSVAWYADRLAVAVPGGDRSNAVEVIRRYHPEYYLYTFYVRGHHQPGFNDKDLKLMDGRNTLEQRWELYRLQLPEFRKPDTAGKKGKGNAP